MRILPRVNDDINEEWISDKARFAYDGLKYQRLDSPYIRQNGKLVEASWSDAIALVAQKLKSLAGNQMATIDGTLACTESISNIWKLVILPFLVSKIKKALP